jgi:hypothetical protein
MNEPTGETFAQRTARRLAETPARDHYWQTWGYARAEGFHRQGQHSELCHEATLELLHGQAIIEDVRR